MIIPLSTQSFRDIHTEPASHRSYEGGVQHSHRGIQDPYALRDILVVPCALLSQLNPTGREQEETLGGILGTHCRDGGADVE